MLNCYLPFPFLLLPDSRGYFDIQLNVSIQIPLFGRSDYIVIYLSATSVKACPIRVWVKWESLHEKTRVKKGPKGKVFILKEYLHRWLKEHHIARLDMC